MSARRTNRPTENTISQRTFSPSGTDAPRFERLSVTPARS
jgi:hypothetical protein